MLRLVALLRDALVGFYQWLTTLGNLLFLDLAVDIIPVVQDPFVKVRAVRASFRHWSTKVLLVQMV